MHGIINLVPKNPQNENDFVCKNESAGAGWKKIIATLTEKSENGEDTMKPKNEARYFC